MSGAPVTLEGWYVLQEMFAVDWPRWNAAAAAERAAAVEEAAELLGAQAAPADGQSGCWAVVGQKADVCLMHWRRDLESLRAEQLAWSRTRLRAYLAPAYSYVSVIERGSPGRVWRARIALAACSRIRWWCLGGRVMRT